MQFALAAAFGKHNKKLNEKKKKKKKRNGFSFSFSVLFSGE